MNIEDFSYKILIIRSMISLSDVIILIIFYLTMISFTFLIESVSLIHFIVALLILNLLFYLKNSRLIYLPRFERKDHIAPIMSFIMIGITFLIYSEFGRIGLITLPFFLFFNYRYVMKRYYLVMKYGSIDRI